MGKFLEKIEVFRLKFALGFGPGVGIGFPVLSGGVKFYPVLARFHWFGKQHTLDYYLTMEQAVKGAERVGEMESFIKMRKDFING